MTSKIDPLEVLEWLYRKSIISKTYLDKGIEKCVRELERQNEEWCWPWRNETEMTSKIDTLKWLYRKKIISKTHRDKGIKEYYRELKQQNEEWSAKKCLKVLAQCAFCCPCAGLCFTGEEETCKQRFCATSLSSVLYGGITTLLSSGVFFKSYTLGLQVGISISAVGSLCAIGLCACKSEMCKCCQDEDCCEQFAGETSSSIPLDPVTSQPSRNSTHCRCSDNSDAESEGALLLQEKSIDS